MKKKYILPVLIILFFANCEKVIDVDVPSIPPKLIIDASFEVYFNQNPVVASTVVKLRLSADYFETAIEINPKLSRALYFQAGEMLMKIENYAKAKERLKEYESFLKSPPEIFENGELELNTETYYNTLLESYLATCSFETIHKPLFNNCHHCI